MTATRRALLVLACIGLASCQRSLIVRVVGDVDHPVIEVENLKGGCVEAIIVEEIGQPSVTVWQVHSTRACSSARSYPYGVLPEGFVTRVEAQPLEDGKTYQMAVAGRGAIGWAGYTVQGDRLEPSARSR